MLQSWDRTAYHTLDEATNTRDSRHNDRHDNVHTTSPSTCHIYVNDTLTLFPHVNGNSPLVKNPLCYCRQIVILALSSYGNCSYFRSSIFFPHLQWYWKSVDMWSITNSIFIILLFFYIPIMLYNKPVWIASPDAVFVQETRLIIWKNRRYYSKYRHRYCHCVWWPCPAWTQTSSLHPLIAIFGKP